MLDEERHGCASIWFGHQTIATVAKTPRGNWLWGWSDEPLKPWNLKEWIDLGKKTSRLLSGKVIVYEFNEW